MTEDTGLQRGGDRVTPTTISAAVGIVTLLGAFIAAYASTQATLSAMQAELEDLERGQRLIAAELLELIKAHHGHAGHTCRHPDPLRRWWADRGSFPEAD